MSTEELLRKKLLAEIEKAAKALGCKPDHAAKRAGQSGAFYGRIKAGGGFTVATYDSIMNNLAALQREARDAKTLAGDEAA